MTEERMNEAKKKMMKKKKSSFRDKHVVRYCALSYSTTHTDAVRRTADGTEYLHFNPTQRNNWASVINA